MSPAETYPMLAGGSGVGASPFYYYAPTLTRKRTIRCVNRCTLHSHHWSRNYELDESWTNGGFSSMPVLEEINDVISAWWDELPLALKLVYDREIVVNHYSLTQVATRQLWTELHPILPGDDPEAWQANDRTRYLLGGFFAWIGIIYEFQFWTNALRRIEYRGRPRKT